MTFRFLVCPKKNNFHYKFNDFDTDNRARRSDAMYLSFAESVFQRPCRSMESCVSPALAAAVAPPTRKLCVPYGEEFKPISDNFAFKSSRVLVYDRGIHLS